MKPAPNDPLAGGRTSVNETEVPEESGVFSGLAERLGFAKHAPAVSSSAQSQSNMGGPLSTPMVWPSVNTFLQWSDVDISDRVAGTKRDSALLDYDLPLHSSRSSSSFHPHITQAAVGTSILCLEKSVRLGLVC
eukprot:TRINITY_DN4228_c0_g2_i9.p3 TRINITY_DN4228_c0_g2~~TRINITY_DN4228_c0_g2_i9.p3  ORF type:complete len:134 (+),score=14.66 TRINITY_DN4228_c0_g2_i9:511-912(+)